ncbi:MAG: hypothetical protein IPL52_09060 [Flavobacteriales bacterium]|nr:hypothetical protein [Flavobacteriales bacterium]
MRHVLLLPTVMLAGCTSLTDTSIAQDAPCEAVPAAFVEHVSLVLSDTTGRFFNDYPMPTPLTCELLAMMQEALKDDSVRYHFEHLHQRFGDPRANAAFTYIKRHVHFQLAMALATHWNPDTRIEAIRAVHEYRRIRPMVCATKEHYAQLEEQDRAAVRYFIRVLQTTPLFIAGSENSTIHGVYIMEVMRTLDLFTGQTHNPHGDMRRALDMPDPRFQQALVDWRNWLGQ